VTAALPAWGVVSIHTRSVLALPVFESAIFISDFVS
jgi:hypothetical protein